MNKLWNVSGTEPEIIERNECDETSFSSESSMEWWT
ncbi:hypothetical protein J2T12_003850 [Paenibacillus anaericanus]|nr:hypothetical protein [Paenibacillus anaericanus]